MSIYVLIDYIEFCKENNISPNLYKLGDYKRRYWRD